MTDLTLPDRTRKLIASCPPKQRHPGLQLDKFSPPGPQSGQGPKLTDVVEAAGDRELLKTRLADWRNALSRLGAREFEGKTIGAMTLHLARASALENAGICLHPLFGFAYLPGSGLKGMARAWAETVWLGAQSDKRKALDLILDVFGWAPGWDKGKDWLPQDRNALPISASTGEVIFHDAWPLSWPELLVDVTTNHHPKYYQGTDAPGDWQDPIPINFLAIKPGAGFLFAVAPRPGGARHDLVAQAEEWLAASLVHSGAGAKTNSGYGAFSVTGRAVAPIKSPDRVDYSANLTLASPAFLAGADQKSKEGCDLRPSTLRGQLRWWWRTLHAAHMDDDRLRALEAAVWGNTQSGSAIRLVLGPGGTAPKPSPYDKKQVGRTKGLEEPPRGSKTVMGLYYASYGMDDSGKRRHVIEPGAAWTLSLTARAAKLEKRKIPADLVMKEALAALWLLCRYGGVGAKSRKGFGSFSDLKVGDIASVEDCKKTAMELRQICGMTSASRKAPEVATLENAKFFEQPLSFEKDSWRAIDRIGNLMQGFAKSLKKNEKAELGLPRTGARSRDKRHASPIHWHLARSPDGTCTIRAAAFATDRLTGMKSSQPVMERLGTYLAANAGQRPNPSRQAGRSSASRSAPQPAPMRAGSLVGRKGTYSEESVEVLEERGTRLVVRFEDGETAEIERSSFTPD